MRESLPNAVQRIAIVEDHVLQRRRTEQLITADRGLRVVFSGESMPAFLRWLRGAPSSAHPQLLVLDLQIDRQPSVDVSLVSSLLRAGLRIVVLSALASPPLVRGVVRAGVQGVVGKRDSEEDVLSAIHAVLRGQEWMSTEAAGVIAGDPQRPTLSIQEERCLILYASGLTLDEVASTVNIKPDTAKQYLNRVRAKYSAVGVQARTKLDLTRIAWLDGYVDPLLPHDAPTIDGSADEE